MNESADCIRRISIVNFTGIRTNWGCQATSWELLKFLNSSFSNKNLPLISLIPLLPRYDVDKQIEDYEIDRIHESISIVSSTKSSKSSIQKSISYLEKICIERYGVFAKEVSESDVVFFQGEGTMAGTDFLQSARLVLLPFVARHAWGKPVYSLNQTIFLATEKSSEVIRSAYNTFDFVAVRENVSVSAARRAGIDPVFHIPDTAFLTVPGPDCRLPKLEGNRYFMVTGSAYFSQDVHEHIFAAADQIKSRTKLIPVIAASTGPDRKLGELASKYWQPGSYEIVPPEVSYCAVASAMKQCRFLLSGRYHMTIMATSVGLPTIQVAGNSYKNEGLSAMLGGLSPVKDLAHTDAIVKAAREILDGSFALPRLQSARRAILNSLSDASDWLKDSLSGRKSPFPSSFLFPPGQEIDSSAYMEPYRTNSIDRTKSFEYPPAVGDGLGPKPHGSNMLPHLLSSHLGGDSRALPAIGQVLQSYPDAIKQIDEATRSELGNLPIGIQPATAPVSHAYNISIVDRLMSSTLSAMKHRRVDGQEKHYSYGTLPHLADQIEMVKQEFVGVAELCLYHTILIILIRRNIRLEDNIQRFFTLWKQEGSFLCSNLDSRWLVSACDTIIDHGQERDERAFAMAASLFTNTVKLYETERWATYQKELRQSYRSITGRVPLHDGLSAFVIGHGDMIGNLQHRARSISNTNSVAALILNELMGRAFSFDTVFKRFANSTDDLQNSWNVFERWGHVSRFLRRLLSLGA